MRYVIVTVEWCLLRGIIVPEHARRSLDGNKVIMHSDFIAPVMGETEEIESYAYDSDELGAILSSPEWTEQKEEE